MKLIPRPRRWLQFSLRSILVILALFAVSIRAAQWYLTSLNYLQWKHGHLMNAGEFEESLTVAATAQRLYPEAPVVQTLLWKSKFAIKIMTQELAAVSAEEGYFTHCVSENDTTSDR